MSINGSHITLKGLETPLKSNGTVKQKPLLRRVALLEIIIFLGGAMLIDQLVFDGSRFRTLEPHPFWLPIILLSVQYGTRIGLVSVFACTLVLLVGNIPAQQLGQDLHQWFFSVFKLPLLWFVSAVVIGEISARHIALNVRLNEALSNATAREATLTDSFFSLISIKERLETRIAGQWRTVSKTLKAARALEYVEPSQILNQSQDLVENLLAPEKFSIYILRDNALHCVFDRGWDKDRDYLRLIKSDSPLFNTIVDERRIMCISSPKDEGLLEGQGVLAGPLKAPETNELLGMLKIEKQPFGQLSLNTVKNFEFLCEWIGTIYGRAVTYQSKRGTLRELHFQGTAKHRATSFVNKFEHPIKAEPHSQNANLVKPHSGVTTKSDSITHSDTSFTHQKVLFLKLASHLDIPFTMLSLKLSDFGNLSEYQIKRFSFILDTVLNRALGSTKRAFSHHRGSGWIFILLPGLNEEDTQYLVTLIGKVLTQAWESGPIQYSYQIQSLKTDES